ncbi:MAG: LysR family transcriptional regulator [Clostridiales bacterium]|nr:LysR family transcriptional regulator [Clostridiales bacterium]
MYFTHLNYFKTVVECGSILRASNELYLSQSALSTSISSLEAELGQPLFDRVNNRLLLTDYGKYFYDLALKLLSVWQSCLEHDGDISEENRISILVDKTCVPYEVILRLLEAVRDDLEIRFVIRTEPVFMSNLKTDIVDWEILLSHDKLYSTYFAHQYTPPRANSSLYVLLPDHYPQAALDTVKLSDLRGCEFCALKEGDQYEPGIYECLKEGFMPQSRFVVNSADLKQIILSRGTLAGFVTSRSMPDFAGIPNTKLVPVDTDYRELSLCLYWTEFANETPAFSRCIELLKNCIRSDFP